MVSNPSFEDTVSCPYSNEIYKIIDWSNPSTAGTPDVYHSCTGIFPEFNGYAFQYPGEGQCALGLYAQGDDGTDLREYIQGQLVSPLNAGSTYCVSFFVNLLDSFSFATYGMGMYIPNSPISSSDWFPLPYTPQVSNPSGNILTDKIGWTKITGSFVASGGEQFITIGNFNNDLNCNMVFVGPSTGPPWPYYLIDAVSIVEAGLMANAGNDTTLFSGDSILIGNSDTGVDCDWYDEDGTFIVNSVSGIYVQPANSTFYVMEQNLCGTITTDTIYVNVIQTATIDDRISPLPKIYPNPTDGLIYIDYDGYKPERGSFIKVYDISGKICFFSNLPEGELTTALNLDALEPGTYLYSISTDEMDLPAMGVVILH